MSNGYNFSERVRKCLAQAREESHALHHEYVGTEHILLGLIRDGEGVAIAVLQTMGIDLEKIRSDLLQAVKPGKTPGPGETIGPDLPYTSRAKRVLELAMSEARKLSHSYVGTEHILLGLVAEERGAAAQVLRHNGADIDRVRTEVLRILGSASSSSSEFTKIPEDVKTIESVTIKVRYTDGSFDHEVFKDVERGIMHLTSYLT